MQSVNSVSLCVCKLDGLYYICIYNDDLLKQLLAKELFEGILHICKYGKQIWHIVSYIILSVHILFACRFTYVMLKNIVNMWVNGVVIR